MKLFCRLNFSRMHRSWKDCLRFEKIFWFLNSYLRLLSRVSKNLEKRFAGFKNSTYLCNPFRNESSDSTEKKSWKRFAGFKNSTYLCNPFRTLNVKSFWSGSLNYWLYFESKIVVFICQFPLKETNSQDSNETFILYTMESLILAQDER